MDEVGSWIPIKLAKKHIEIFWLGAVKATISHKMFETDSSFHVKQRRTGKV